MSLISGLRSIGNFLWDALPGLGPLFDDGSGDSRDELKALEGSVMSPL